MAEDPAKQAKTLYESGQLAAAIEALTKGVKGNPNDGRLRTFLFELLCFAGEWQRADKQLDVIGHTGASAEIGVQVYRNCVKAESDRRRLITDGLAPHFLTEPPAYVDMHLEAVNRMREGNAQAVAETLDKAEELRPAISGSNNGLKFEDFRDYDDLFGPVLELLVQDKYTWVPIEQVIEITFDPPTQLRDLIWSPVSVQTADKNLRAFIPNLYVNSSDEPDEMIKLGRMTDWKEIGEGVFRGAGLRTFAVDGEEVAILGMKSIAFDANANTAAAAATDE